MVELMKQIEKELMEIGKKGVNASNLELISKLAETYKDLSEVEEKRKGGHEMQEYGRYREGDYNAYRERGYNARGNYREGGYNDGYGRRYSRMRDHMDRMMDGMDQYEYGKERYMHGGDDGRVMEGLEKIMYAICMFVESAMDFAETPQEKELIRNHIQKMTKV